MIQIVRGPAERFAWICPSRACRRGRRVETRARRAAGVRPTRTTCRSRRFSSPACGARGRTAARRRLGRRSDGGPRDPRRARAGRGTVGPYDYRVIAVDPGSPDPAEVAIDGSERGLRRARSAPRSRPYLGDGLNLLAFKLTKDSDSGSIRPVMITYEAERPSIPIRPTAVAAERRHGRAGLRALGRARVPQNYKALELNEALIDWFNPMGNYDDVVSRAADEAQGQGFVTEFAGEHESSANGVVEATEQHLWSVLLPHGHKRPTRLVHRRGAAWAPGRDSMTRWRQPSPCRESLADYISCPSATRPTPRHVRCALRSFERCSRSEYRAARPRSGSEDAPLPDAALHDDEPRRDDHGPALSISMAISPMFLNVHTAERSGRLRWQFLE